MRPSVPDATPSLTKLIWLTGMALGVASCSVAGVQTADTALYVHSDTNDIVVVAPRTHVGAMVGDSFGLDATYTMDSWTGASIDVVTAATDAIHELRHEINASTSYEFENARLSATYRYSTENDYWSHGGVLGVDVDMAQNNTTLSLAVLGSDDTVGRFGVPSFRRAQNSLGGRVGLSQVLDKKTVLQLTGDMIWFTGYMASPYRFVGVGGPGLCARQAAFCVPEIHPHERLRTALSADIRRALAERLSAGIGYRYYFDDWGLSSHTGSPDLTILLGEHGTLSLLYRFYIQSRADFYQPEYTGPLSSYTYVSRDRKMSALLSHKVSAQYVHEVPAGNTLLELGLRGGVARYDYKEFIGLDTVDVLEVTASMELTFQ